MSRGGTRTAPHSRVPTGERGTPIADRGLMPYGIRLRAYEADSAEPMQPGGDRCVVRDGGVFRAWQLGVATPGSANTRAAFEITAIESSDGFAWRKSGAWRFTSPGGPHPDVLAVFIDPVAPPIERYKGVFSIAPPREESAARFEEYARVHAYHRIFRFRPDSAICVHGLVSRDGINWSLLPDPLMVHNSDTDTAIYYDSPLRKYVMYTRLMFQNRRWIGRATSDDFRKWSTIDPILAPSLGWSPTCDLYLNSYCTHPDEPSYQFMFPMVYDRWTQRSDMRFYSSEEGIYWAEVPGGPVITRERHGPPGAEFMAGGKGLFNFGDRVGLPFASTPYPHKYPRWKHVLDAGTNHWAFWHRGRISGLVADGLGEFWTMPMNVQGKTLRINARVPKAGELRIGVVGVDGRSINDCDLITGDHLAHTVTWRGDDNARAKPGVETTLHFRLRAADLFGFEWV